MHASCVAERIAGNGIAEPLEDPDPVLETVFDQIPSGLKAGVAADSGLRRRALVEGVDAVVDRQKCRRALNAVARERDEHQPGVEREGVGRFQRGEGVLKNQGWLNVLPARQLLAEVRRISYDEERDVLRDLSRKEQAQASHEQIVRVGLVIRIANRVGLKLAEDSELEVHIVVGFDDDLRPGRQRSDQEDGNDAGGGTMCVHAHAVHEGNARATSPLRTCRGPICRFFALSGTAVCR